MPQFAALGATVIGVSHDPIDKLDKFSVSECRSKFPVAADPDESVIKSYDAVLAQKPQYANRTSYVIAPDHSILMTYTDLNPDQHVAQTLAAVKKWHRCQSWTGVEIATTLDPWRAGAAKRPRAMIELTQEFTFDAAHYLDTGAAENRRIHGHSFYVDVTLRGEPGAGGRGFCVRSWRGLRARWPR